MRVSSSVNPGSDYKGGLGCKTKCYRHVYCWVFWDNYIQQLLKGKDGIVMKRSLYRVINNLRANYWALIICITISTLVIIFSLLNCSLEVFELELEHEFEPITRHTRLSSSTWRVVSCYSHASATLR